MDLNALKRQYAEIKNQMRAITATAEKRDDSKLTEQEAEKWSALRNEADEMRKRIEQAEYMDQLEREEGTEEPEGRSADDPQGFAEPGEFYKAVRNACMPGGHVDPRLSMEQRAASGMQETDPAQGGVLVPSQIMSGILKRTYEFSQVANRCRKIGVGANFNGISMKGIDETSRATGSRWGGVRGYWKAEADTATDSNPKFRTIDMDLQKLMAFSYATDELLEDTQALASVIDQSIAEEFAWLLDEAIISGTGAGTPMGILKSDALVSVAKEDGQAADTIVYENIVAMWSRMWARSRANAVWYINQDCEPQLDTMALVVGTGGIPVYLPAGGISGAPYSTLKGRPVIPIEQAKTVGDLGDIMLTDMSQYLLIDKGGLNRDVSMHVRFLYAEQTFRFTYRVNGQPLWNSALTPANGSNTLSPFVALAARA